MFNIGTGEMIMIAVVALLVLGPSRLPELARGIGKFLREFRRQTDDVRNVVEREFYRMDQEVMNPQQPVPPATADVPQVQPAPDAVAQGLPDQIHPPGEPKQEELALQAPGSPPPMDESEPGHPDYHREEKPAPAEPAAAANSDTSSTSAPGAVPPEQKVG